MWLLYCTERATAALACLRIFLLAALLAGAVGRAGELSLAPGTSLDDLALEEIGIDPHLFLFTGNNIFPGITQLDIVSDTADPATSASLSSAAQHTVITFDDSGLIAQVSDAEATTPVKGGGQTGAANDVTQSLVSVAAPEPNSLLLCGAGLSLLGAGLLAKRRQFVVKLQEPGHR